jgi:hypothetical protein
MSVTGNSTTMPLTSWRLRVTKLSDPCLITISESDSMYDCDGN